MLKRTGQKEAEAWEKLAKSWSEQNECGELGKWPLVMCRWAA